VCFRCSWILGEDGEAHEFTPRDQEMMVRTVIEPMASDGLRTICLAYKDYVKGINHHHKTTQLQFVCVVKPTAVKWQIMKTLSAQKPAFTLIPVSHWPVVTVKVRFCARTKF